MSAGAHDRDGMIRRHRIEFLAQGMTSDIKLELIVSSPLDPLARRRDRDALPDIFQQRGERRRGGGPYVHMAHDHPIGEKMHVRVAQSRRCETAREIDYPRRWADERLHVGGRSCREYPPRPKGDCFGGPALKFREKRGRCLRTISALGRMGMEPLVRRKAVAASAAVEGSRSLHTF